MKRLLKFLGAAAIALGVIAAVFLFLGYRVYLDGGGGFQVGYIGSSDAHARSVEAHREAQKTAAPPVVPPPSAAVEPTAPPAPVVASTAWINFRGINRDGRYSERPLLATWPGAGGLKPLWKQPVGEGYASFVAAGGRAFTIEQRGPNEVVAAYDVMTGRELWASTWAARFSEMMGGDGPRATPTYADGTLYALGGAGELRALDANTGNTIWRENILSDAGASNIQWGMSASPLVVDDALVVLPGGSNGQSVAAYDRRTGKRLWSALNDTASYSSPMLVTLGGVRQILVFTALRLAGLSPDNGTLLWEYPWRTQYDVNASQPVVIGDNRIFLSTGYGTGAAVIELTPSGRAFNVREVWRNIRMKNQFSSSVLHDGFIYGLDESILACVDAATGELKWKGGRYGYGQIVLAGDRVIVLTEQGDLALVRATPEKHDELARFSAIAGKTWNHPAIADGILLVRNLREMAAFDLRRRP